MSDKNKIPPAPPADGGEETAHYDDPVIGRAFRGSAVAVLFLAVVGASVYVVFQKQAPPPPAKITQLAAPKLAAAPVAEVPVARFTDVTASSGIKFTHINGAYG